MLAEEFQAELLQPLKALQVAGADFAAVINQNLFSSPFDVA